MVPTYAFMIHNCYTRSCVRFRTSVKCKCGRYIVQHYYLEYNHGEVVLWSTQQNNTNLPPNHQLIYSHFPLMLKYFPRFHTSGLHIDPICLHINIRLQIAMSGVGTILFFRLDSHYIVFSQLTNLGNS